MAMDAVNDAMTWAKKERQLRAQYRAQEARASALQSARDAVVEAAKLARLALLRVQATKDSDEWSRVVIACDDAFDALRAATDRLIALEEQT